MNKKVQTEKVERVNLKLKKEDLIQLKKKAKRHTEGNLSEWMRLSGLKYVPKTGKSKK